MKDSKFFRALCWAILYLCIVQSAAEPQTWSQGGWVISGGSGTTIPNTWTQLQTYTGSPVATDVTGPTGVSNSSPNSCWTAQENNGSPQVRDFCFIADSQGFSNGTATFDLQTRLNGGGFSTMFQLGTNLGMVFLVPSGADIALSVAGISNIRLGATGAGSAHLLAPNTTLPTVSACGAGPNGSVVGNDMAGQVTIGGGVVTSCTVTFVNPFTTNAPACVISDNSTATTTGVSTTTTAMTLTSAATINGAVVNYVCIGR